MDYRRTYIRDLLKSSPGETVSAYGWVKTRRDSKAVHFVQINDGSCFTDFQIVVDVGSLPEEELGMIRNQMTQGIRQTVLKEEFDVGQQVVVTDGPFANFSGKIDEVNQEKNKIRVLISILGRSTPVELDFEEVKAQPEEG